MSNARIQLPPRILEGDVFKVRLLINHPMDSGFLRDINGVLIKRNVIRQLICTLNNQEVFRAEPTTGIAANPLFEFYLRATKSGELYFRWVDDKGYIGELRQKLVIEPANQSKAPKP
ncbi:MAG: thiosulfate oxidation carrier complex protein SoxZ [Betaproteobacteria bacterium]|nr:thiosulfate oxidation carrier complex protein SoxZ [Betaproteobacteria bacterium]